MKVIIYYRAGTKQSGRKLWIGEMGCDVKRFPHSLMGRLIASCGSVGLREASKKTRPVSAHIPMKVGENGTSRCYCLLQATSPDEDSSQLDTAPRDHLPITKSDVDFERL